MAIGSTAAAAAAAGGGHLQHRRTPPDSHHFTQDTSLTLSVTRIHRGRFDLPNPAVPDRFSVPDRSLPSPNPAAQTDRVSTGRSVEPKRKVAGLGSKALREVEPLEFPALCGKAASKAWLQSLASSALKTERSPIRPNRFPVPPTACHSVLVTPSSSWAPVLPQEMRRPSARTTAKASRPGRKLVADQSRNRPLRPLQKHRRKEAPDVQRVTESHMFTNLCAFLGAKLLLNCSILGLSLQSKGS